MRVGDVVAIDGSEGHHGVSVRRVSVGERVELVDGGGLRASAKVTSVQKRSFTVAIDAVQVEQRPGPTVTVVQALLKGDRSELAVELMTELGVDRIVPWRAERCIARWDDAKAAKAVEKWRATAREAAKQSRQAHIPTVSTPIETSELPALIAAADAAYVLHEQAMPTDVQVPAEGSVLVIVGPEGGITDAELDDMNGATKLRLGPTVLRGSTAGAASLAYLFSRTPRWKEMV